MNHKILGTLFFVVSAILISTQYIVTAILTLNLGSSDKGTFYNIFFNSGYVLVVLGVIFFIVGIILFVRDMVEKNNVKTNKKE
ncbi:hypothetical protein M5J14_21680 [Lysinibacillus sp. OL1_EC]|uniref:hypothetical protein n=1 Tax=unclassified Lysinibacillus TaxID=2636778 RepID=UPI00103B281D|nr:MULTISPECIES: hypothetical protein [unclassified Lysinibacillus]MCM0627111.1 hypothetical protein [Lysinibacillus sp. OL1_EC]TBV84775.1 hypothetical protein EW028_24095 [Lysinibacillus sp. OL1]UKJ47752.1 hypothetical protein L6W14_22985 [Lysinibacillus sp. ACHW1.5]